MLTKDLLEFRTRKGQVYPQLIAAKGTASELAESLVGRIRTAHGQSRGEIEADLSAQASGYRRPRIAKGLVKLLLDRATFEEPDPSVVASREGWINEAQDVRQQLPETASFSDYEASLGDRIDLTDVRERLFSDLPARRPLVDFKPIDGPGLIARYDLAQVQGLLLHAQRIELIVGHNDTPELRRLLRWMRFCRLVASVDQDDDGWRLTIEGPAAVVDGAKKYGLQLASFFLVVPTLDSWRLTADVKLPRRAELRLQIADDAGLRPGLEGGAGHVPPELRVALDRFDDPNWTLDPHPSPRPMGVKSWCVPDLAAERGGRVVSIELFHAWHDGALSRRLEELQDPAPARFSDWRRPKAREETGGSWTVRRPSSLVAFRPAGA